MSFKKNDATKEEKCNAFNFETASQWRNEHYTGPAPDYTPDDVKNARNYNAKYVKLDPEATTLYIYDSHGSRMKNKIHKGSYLIYPGYSLSNNLHFNKILSDINKVKEKLNISEIMVIFGSNDVHDAAQDFLIPKDLNFEPSILTKGRNVENFDVSDPLNLFSNMENDTFKHLSSKFEKYFQNLETLTEIFPGARVVISAIGPRYMFGPDSSLQYNFLACFLNFKLYKWSGEREFYVVNSFVKEWRSGTEAMLSVHGVREQVGVTLGDTEYCRYGGVHYCQSKYTEMNTAISKALECCREDNLPCSPTVWTSDGIFIHFLLGNKGAHLSNGNIRCADSSTTTNQCAPSASSGFPHNDQ